MEELDRRLIQVRPSLRQVRQQQMEMYAFVHFTVNTFTDREWGDGTEDPALFDPARLDAMQWVDSVAAAGMKGLILTCKHHDGFCLWPSTLTEHTVAASPFRQGRGDVVREVADACRARGIAFGVYLSPWDRHEPKYGTGKPYDDYFVGQLTELLTGYGEISTVWFDGACGEGPNGKKQYYDWERYYEVIRRLQPNACIHVCGPDIRWCGNEAGDVREAEWSVVPRRTMDTEKIASASQQQDDTSFRQRTIRATDQDLGSRAVLQDEKELIWYPAEVNTSIRPGWFWHASEDDQVKPLAKLIDIYEKSVGGNATFLLNIPPTRDGLFHPEDVARLHAFGDYLRSNYRESLLDTAVLTATDAAPEHEVDCVRGQDDGFYLPAEEKGRAEIIARWTEKQRIRRVVLQEQILMSQRIEHYALDAWQDGAWRQIAEGSVVGYKRIIPLESVETGALRLRITDARVAPTIKFIGVYG